jgi:hypothetical protein
LFVVELEFALEFVGSLPLEVGVSSLEELDVGCSSVELLVGVGYSLVEDFQSERYSMLEFPLYCY